MRRAALGLVVLAACGSYGDAPSSSSSGSSSGGSSGNPSGCDAAVLYVSSKGDDANAGCDLQRPKRTLSSAIGAVQAKGSPAEIRTCTETLRERVVLAYPASIIGGFDCTTWAPGAALDKTTIEAPADATEAIIAFGAPVDKNVRLERLRVVGAARANGPVSGLRFKDNAAPVVRSFEVSGGSTDEGIAIGVAIESASPTLEDGVVDAGSARCSADCKGVIASGISVAGGNARLRRLRISGGTADVAATGPYVGSVALDVFAGAKAVDADAFSELEIVHGVGRVGDILPASGLRVINAEIDLVDSKILPGPSASTCVTATCGSFALLAAGASGSVRVRRSRIITTPLAGAPGTPGVATLQYGLFASDGGKLEVASSFVHSHSTALGAADGSLSFLGSTAVGVGIVSNNGGAVDVKSSILGSTQASGLAFYSTACQRPSRTTLESSVIVGSPPSFAEVLVNQGGTCTGTGAATTLADYVSRSSSDNVITASSTWRVATTCTGEGQACVARASCSDPAACLAEVFASAAPSGGLLLKDGAPCAIAQGGMLLPGAPDDASKKPRTMPFSMGAHEYDGACSN